jgi:hypothetical protein
MNEGQYARKGKTEIQELLEERNSMNRRTWTGDPMGKAEEYRLCK